jgi:phospholipid/cholesterol/gamma-HCH transport system substrate-binding protein
MIGKNKFMFGSNFILKARFENVQGLKSGNNIRFNGIEIGTVKSISIINDTCIEVNMIIEKKLKNIIRTNAVCTIGTDGLVGNKVVNIASGKQPAPAARDNDLLLTSNSADMEALLNSLGRTGNDLEVVVSGLKTTIYKINNSNALWQLLADEKLASQISTSINHFEKTGSDIHKSAENILSMTEDIRDKKGTLGKLISDTGIAVLIDGTFTGIKEAASNLSKMGKRADSSVLDMRQFLLDKEGNLYMFNNDSSFRCRLKSALSNVDEGSKGFTDIMQALKHSFLFRGYFRKKERNR